MIKDFKKLTQEELLEHISEVYNYYEQLCLEVHKRKVQELKLFAAEMIMDTNPGVLRDVPFV